MSEIDLDGALDALSAELPEEYDGEVPEVSDEAVVEDNQPEAESFTGFDPNVLPEDMQKVYKSMQADYTRKTQEIAQIRQQYESLSEQGVDPNDALEAVTLLQRMNNDPSFAASVAQDIQNRLEELGYANTVAQDDAPIDNETESYGDLPPQLQRELEEMRAFRQSMVEQQQQAEIMAELDVAEQTIRATNPDYTDEDMQSIYSLAYATDGDLMAAAEQYHTIQQRLLGNYLQAKTVPHGATPAPGGPTTVPGEGFTSLDDAHKAAMELVRNSS